MGAAGCCTAVAGAWLAPVPKVGWEDPGAAAVEEGGWRLFVSRSAAAGTAPTPLRFAGRMVLKVISQLKC